jgi:hypothetical protein
MIMLTPQCSRWPVLVSQVRNSCMPPPGSARISTFSREKGGTGGAESCVVVGAPDDPRASSGILPEITVRLQYLAVESTTYKVLPARRRCGSRCLNWYIAPACRRTPRRCASCRKLIKRHGKRRLIASDAQVTSQRGHAAPIRPKPSGSVMPKASPAAAPVPDRAQCGTGSRCLARPRFLARNLPRCCTRSR